MTEEKIIKIAKEFDINELVVNRSITESQSIKFENGSFSETDWAQGDSFTIKAFIDGNRLSKRISRPSEDEIRNLFKEIVEENKYKTKEIDEHPTDTSKFKYEKPAKSEFKPLAIVEARKVLKELVKRANEADPRILKQNTSAIYGLGTSTNTFVSTTGTNLSTSPSNNFSIYLIVYFDDGKGAKGVSYVGMIFTDKSQINYDEFIKELKKDIKLQETKTSIESGDYEIVFDQNAFMTLMGNFLMHLNGREVVDGVSRWKNSIGKKIASTNLNLIDEPISKELGVYITYDDDATPTKNQHFIKNGKLEKFITNNKLAELLKTKSSGNAKGSGTTLINPYIDTGKDKEKDIISSVKKGLLASSFSGMHSGINPISGEFSIEVKGNLIEDGKIKGEIEGAVISGNFFKDVLPNIDMVANTREARKMVRSPMIKLSKKLAISA